MLAGFLAWGALAGLLSSGTCVVAYHSCTDPCCPHEGRELPPDCPGAGRADAGSPIGAGIAAHPALAQYRLEHYRVVRASRAREHPVRALTDVRGVRVPFSLGASGLVQLCERVRLANPELLGLPLGCGELHPLEVRESGAAVEVRFQQVSRGPHGAVAVGGAGQTFVFDARGRLVLIDNATVLAWRAQTQSRGAR